MNASGEHTPLLVRVSGPFACFTRPEMKVERVTYDVMTPSAARGILEAIDYYDFYNTCRAPQKALNV